MKLSALLILVAGASMCIAQSKAGSLQTAPAAVQNPQVGIVDDQAISRAAAALAESAAKKELQKTMDRVNQAKCPVVLTSASLTPHLMLLKTSADSPGNGVDLEFRNTSGKEIRLMEFSARILVKRSIYDLDYQPAIHLYLTAYGTQSVDATFAQLRHLPLPEGIHAGLVEGVTLEQVAFEDGSVWTPTNNDYYGISPNQMLPVAR